MSLLLPVDDNGHPISLLGFVYRGTQRFSVTTTSARNPIPLADEVQVVTLIATGACRFEVGGATITADRTTSPFLAPGQYVDVPLRGAERYVAFVAEDTPCTLYVMGRL
jgi:hypothetical protein